MTRTNRMRSQPGEEVEEGRLSQGSVGRGWELEREEGRLQEEFQAGTPLHALSGEFQLDPQVDGDLVSRFR